MKRMEMEACMKLWIDTDEAYGHMKHGSGWAWRLMEAETYKANGSMKHETWGNMKRLMPYETWIYETWKHDRSMKLMTYGNIVMEAANLSSLWRRPELVTYYIETWRTGDMVKRGMETWKLMTAWWHEHETWHEAWHNGMMTWNMKDMETHSGNMEAWKYDRIRSYGNMTWTISKHRLMSNMTSSIGKLIRTWNLASMKHQKHGMKWKHGMEAYETWNMWQIKAWSINISGIKHGNMKTWFWWQWRLMTHETWHWKHETWSMKHESIWLETWTWKHEWKHEAA
jgi:hypothetical protein